MKHECSIIIPCFNEEPTLFELLTELTGNSYLVDNCSVIVVNDGSSDNSGPIARKFSEVCVIDHPENRGRGAAISTGIEAATGDYIVIFDADLEYSVADLESVVRSIETNTVVYGSRYLDETNWRLKRLGYLVPLRGQSLGPFGINGLIRLIIFLRFRVNYTDHFSGIRAYPRDFLAGYKWNRNGFAGDHEKACAALKLGLVVREIPIAYQPRSKAEGKKIGARDAFEAIATCCSSASVVAVESSK